VAPSRPPFGAVTAGRNPVSLRSRENTNCLLEFDNTSSPRCKIHEAVRRPCNNRISPRGCAESSRISERARAGAREIFVQPASGSNRDYRLTLNLFFPPAPRGPCVTLHVEGCRCVWRLCRVTVFRGDAYALNFSAAGDSSGYVCVKRDRPCNQRS